MKSASLFLSIAALAPAALAQGLRQATGGVGGASYTHQWYPEPTEEVSNCEAELITTLCDYKEPLSGTAVASSGKKMCWEYCNKNQPCNFVIFLAGNPYTGSGTCWVFPGEEFDESLGEKGCDYMSVYNKPVCTGDNGTPTSDACEATNSPSAVAEVCDYPAPDDDCFYSCSASSGATNCMSQCVESDSCSFAIFNPRNEMNSQYYSGTCWMYPEGEFDKKKAKTCKDHTEQFVYENPCPKPKPKPKSKPSASQTSSGGDSTDSPKSSETGAGGKGGEESKGGSQVNAEQDGASEGKDESGKGGDDGNGSMTMGASLGGTVAVGLAVMMWQGI